MPRRPDFSRLDQTESSAFCLAQVPPGLLPAWSGNDSIQCHELSTRPTLQPPFIEGSERPLTRLCQQRIVCLTFEKGGNPMSLMCSLAVCKAQEGMCGHEKAMLSIAVLAAIGFGAYYLIG